MREKIKSGDVLAWSHKGWNSWYNLKVALVRMFTRSEYSHVGIAWVIANRVFIIEAVSAGTRIFPLSKELPFYWIPTALDWTQEVEEFALAHVGEAYSQWDAVLAFFGCINTKDKKWECAEFVQVILKELKIQLPNKATPSEVIQDLQRLGYPLYFVLAE